jgi:deoxycytidine triphosphate deaminase
MALLTDSDLKSLLRKENPIIKGINLSGNLDGIHSPIQPCSIDLRMSEIFLPSEENLQIEEISRKHCWKLGVGESVKVTTLEEFDLPNCYGALLLAPARLTRRGVVVLDTGHIDPGFQGKLRLTLINMGKHPYELRTGDPVATVLIFRLEKSVEFGLKDRKDDKAPYEGGLDDINCLSPDFLNIQKRAINTARKEAKQAVGQSGWRFVFVSVFLPIILGILTAWVTYLVTFENRLRAIENQSTAFGSNLESEKRLQRLENELANLRNSSIPKDEFNTRLRSLELEIQQLNQQR